MSYRIPHWIDGTRQDGRPDDPNGDVFDPAVGQVKGVVPLAGEHVVADALAAASTAARKWRTTSLARRAEILLAFRELVAARRHELAEIITAEHGKVLEDANGEIGRGLEVVELACGAQQLLKGEFTEGASTSVDVYSIRQPLGVVGIISPFNFPAMVPMWFFPLAIAAGNAVVLKPSEKDPSASVWLAERFGEAGLPPGVLNVVQGSKPAVDALLDHPGVAAISFVGSTPVARYVYERGSAAGKRVQALGGAKNHMIVLPDADLDLAADAAVSAGFGSAGERCMAISIVVAVEPIGDELVDRIRGRIGSLRTGDGRRGCDMGPLITAQHRDRVASYLDAGVEEGAKLVIDGRDVREVDGAPEGFWLKPSLLDHVTPAMRVYRDEIFGPVLGVVRARSYDEAVRLVNDSRYGNGTALFTQNGRAARQFQYDVQVGMVGINVPIPVPIGAYSFGGWKSSLYGDLHAYGPDGIRFYTRTKVVTSRWPEPTGGVDLGFPGSA